MLHGEWPSLKRFTGLNIRIFHFSGFSRVLRKFSHEYKCLYLIIRTSGQSNVKVFLQKLQWGWKREHLAQWIFPHLWYHIYPYQRARLKYTQGLKYMPGSGAECVLHWVYPIDSTIDTVLSRIFQCGDGQEIWLIISQVCRY